MKICLLICTRNGAATIAEAIACIGQQIHAREESYEVIVVDNGSTDDTMLRAEEALRNLRCKTTLLREWREGKVNAILRGVQAASAPLVSIVDDDNLLGGEFITRTVALFDEFPELGMVGSVNSLLISGEPPAWFEYAADRFACGGACLSGEITRLDNFRTIASRGVIAGAGSTFRREPLLEALAKGFSFINETLRSARMITGEDTELCYLLQHLGYWFGTDTRITLRHKVNPARLTWPYALRLYRSSGKGALAVDAFVVMEDEERELPFARFRRTWWWMAARRLRRILNLLPEVIRAVARGRRVDTVWLRWEEQIGALQRIVEERGRYTNRMKAMLNSEWRNLRLAPQYQRRIEGAPGGDFPSPQQPSENRC